MVRLGAERGDAMSMSAPGQVKALVSRKTLLKTIAVAALSLSIGSGKSLASTSHYYYDPSGRLIGTTSEGSQYKAYQYKKSSNRSFYDLYVAGGSSTGWSLTPGQALFQGQTLTAGDGSHVLSLQEDGNLVLYNMTSSTTPVPIWSTGTFLTSGAMLLMQGDGNLVLFDAQANGIWSSGQTGKSGASFVVQTDGNLVEYDSSGHSFWASNTNGQ